MKISLKYHPLLKIINNSLITLPAPNNISYWWNFGSLLGICLITQIITGIILSIHYTPNILLAFDSIAHISRDVNYGWYIRLIHANGASIFFTCLYTHVGRGIYYSSFFYTQAWLSGVIILFLVIMTAFMGYVLPWGQMSFWGATVITNLLSAIPYLGEFIVQWIWGGFAIDNATLNRFFSIHFILPFIILALIIIHLLFIHQTGSNNPLGIKSDSSRVPFHPYFTFKDLLGFIYLFLTLIIITLLTPYILRDRENFIPANPLVTPIHIQPEWYFLFAYAILRSIPNKLGGVIALIRSIAILAILPFSSVRILRSNQFYLFSKILFWIITNTVVLLTWIGARPVEIPYILLGQILTIAYFSYFLINPIINHFYNYTLK